MSGMLKLGMPAEAEVGPRESRVNSPHVFSLPMCMGNQLVGGPLKLGMPA